MEILSFIFSAENIRTAIILMAILFMRSEFLHKLTVVELGFEKRLSELREELRMEIGKFRDEINATLDARFTAFHKQLKENDFAHLERTIKALTYMLEKNKFLSADDKKFYRRTS